MAICASALGSFEEAARSFAAAAEEFEHLGLLVNRVKCRHSLGLALVEAGRPNDAIVVLEKAFKELEALGMQGDANLAALTLVEALYAAGRRAEVPAICRILVDRFVRAKIQGPALIALSFLRETVATGHATTAVVRHVHDFIGHVNLGYNPATFTPPPITPTSRLDG